MPDYDQTPPAPPGQQRLDRRGLFRTAGLGAGALALGTLSRAAVADAAEAAATSTPSDFDILNFALNLEYLEAEFYQRAVYGWGLSAADTSGTGPHGSVTGGSKVPFTTKAALQYATEIANDELAHVRFLRSALGRAAVAEPSIDLSSSFTDAAVAAGLIQPGQTFDPFSSEDNFLLGSFIFEDVGVTAYHGAAPLISNRAYLLAAAGILAVEAYHAAEIRLLILQTSVALAEAADKISEARGRLDGSTGGGHDQGVYLNNVANIVPTDANSLAFARTFDEVKNIVYLGGASGSYGFFPDRLNGNIR